MTSRANLGEAPQSVPGNKDYGIVGPISVLTTVSLACNPLQYMSVGFGVSAHRSSSDDPPCPPAGAAQLTGVRTPAKASRGSLRVNAVATAAPPKTDKATPLELGYTMPGND